MAEHRAAGSSTAASWTRTLGYFGLIVFLFVLGSGATPLLGAVHASTAGASPGSLASAHHAAARVITPHVGGHPTITSFTATPPAILQGQSTTIATVATGLGNVSNYTYRYHGLPHGCASANVSSFLCTPTVNGSFYLQVNVTEPNHNGTVANLTLTVAPYTTGGFYVGNSTLSDLPHAQQLCKTVNSAPFYSVSCYSQAQYPSVMQLSNGHLAVAYEQYTESTTNACPGAAANTTARVAVSISTNGGHNYGAPTQIGNTSCSYLNAIEPTFANTGAHIYGAFVEENSSPSVLPADYGSRAGDALGFVTSANNGGTWSSVRTLVATGDIARPELASVGSTIYIVYEDIANSSSPIGGGWLPISIQFIASTTGGATWSAPVTLPGLNATAGYDALGASIAIAPNGNVTVAYATNRSCVNPSAAKGCLAFGDDIYTITSATNGSTWGPLELVAAGLGENTCYSSGCLPSYFESTPETTVAYDSAGDLYVLYTGTIHGVAFNPALAFRYSAIYYAVSANSGGLWSISPLAVEGAGWLTNYFNPAIGIHGTNVVLTYSADNETQGTAVYDSSLSQWVTSTPTGTAASFSTPIVTSIQSMPFGRLTNFSRSSFVGMTGSVAFSSGGSAYIAYSIARAPTIHVNSGPGYYYTNTTYSTNLTVAFRALPTDYGLVVNVSFRQVGLPLNDSWRLVIMGQTFVVNNQSLTITNVPRGVTVVFNISLLSVGWTEGSTTQSILSPHVFTANATVNSTYSLSFGQDWYAAGGALPSATSKATYEFEVEYYFYQYPIYISFGIFIDQFGGSPFFEAYYDNYNYAKGIYQDSFCDGSGSVIPVPCVVGQPGVSYNYGQPLPFYFPAGFRFQLQIFSYELGIPSYTNGTGTGAISGGLYCEYTFECSSADWYGYTDNNITILSPGNQTIWFGAASSTEYNTTVIPVGLPAGSTYHFTWVAQAYNATAPTTTLVPNETLGAYAVSDIWATSSVAGYEYFGHLDGYANHVLVPWTPNVNLTYDAYEDLALAPQQLTVHAVGLPNGVPWTFSFNGTVYGSSSVDRNLSAHPGTYTFRAADAIAASGATGYTPSGAPSSVSVGPTGTVLNITYVPAYKVSATAGQGGVFSVNSGPALASYTTWAPAGAQLNFTASPNPGYAFVGWSGTGAGSASGSGTLAKVTVGSAITEAASFEALPNARFNLTFLESGLPAGTEWTVQLDGTGYSSSSPSLTVSGLYAGTSGPQGIYTLTVPPAFKNSSAQVQYFAVTPPATVSTNGSGTPPVNLAYQPESSVTVTATVGGSASATSGASTGGTIWAANGSQVTLFEKASSGYTFASWTGTGPGSYTGTNPAPSFVVQGDPVSEIASFTQNPVQKAPTYSVSFSLPAPLAAGTTWSVLVNGLGYSSSGATLTVNGLAGASTYPVVYAVAYSPDGLTQYTPLATNPASVHVTNANLTGASAVPVGFSTDYWVSISASSGGATTPASGWYAQGHTISINATPFGTEQFVKWVGTGPGSYSGSNAGAPVTVNGPITEVAWFQTPTVQHSTTVSSIWQNVGLLGGLAIAGLIVGLAIGLLAFRRGREPPAAEAPAPEGVGAPADEAPSSTEGT